MSISKKQIINKYRKSALPEMIPLWAKHGVKKLINPQAPRQSVSYRNASWVRSMGKKYEKELIRRESREIVSPTIRQNRSYSLLSLCAEKVIQEILNKRYYTFDDMMIISDPYYQADLTALALFYTKEPCRVRYTVKGKDKKKNADYSVTVDEARDHRIPILGLYPNYQNKVLMELLDENGSVKAERTVTIKTNPLPKELKDAVWCKKHTEKSAYDMIMISGGIQIRTLAFDDNGDIRYYLRRYTRSYGIFPLSNGRFLFTEKWINVPSYSVSQACMMYEMDYMGRIYKTYFCEHGFHHGACEMEPGGNILVCSSSMEGYEENFIIELDRKSGMIADSFNLNVYFTKKLIEGPGYIHLNSIYYYPEEKSVIVSMRNNNTVAKINWETKELIWVLAYPLSYAGEKIENKVLRAKGDIKWFFQQHAAYRLCKSPDGNPDIIHLLIYDNHWAKRVQVDWYDGDMEHSYVTVFSINEKELTVEQIYCAKVDNSRIRSNAIIELDKNRMFNMAGSLEPDIEEAHGMVEEYDYEKGGLLNRWYVVPGFFKAYPFEPDVNSLALPMETSGIEYWKGTTLKMEPYEGVFLTGEAKRPKIRENEDSEEIMQDLSFEDFETDEKAEGKYTAKEIKARFQEDLLLIECMDHAVSYVYLKGERTYRGDLTGTYQTKDFRKDSVYEIPFWLKDIESGTYHIYYDCSGEIYDSEDEFTIGK